MMTIISHVGERDFEWSMREDGSVWCDGEKKEIRLQMLTQHRVAVFLGSQTFDATVVENAGTFEISMNGNLYRAEVKSGLKRKLFDALGSADTRRAQVEVRSPMPGMVVRCEVQQGSSVKRGEGLLILEAMKMENEIKAPADGMIEKILISEREIVDKGQILLTIQ